MRPPEVTDCYHIIYHLGLPSAAFLGPTEGTWLGNCEAADSAQSMAQSQ